MHHLRVAARRVHLIDELEARAVTRASDLADVEGYIGIQSETSAVEFRRIDIQRLER